MKVTPNFHVEELLHPSYLKQFGASRCKKFLETNCRPRLITLEAEREYFGVMTINDYLFKDGGADDPTAYVNSGSRILTDQLGSNFSSHYAFDTDDIKYGNVTTDEALAVILENPDRFPFIMRIENINFTRTKHGKLGRDWFHQETGLRLSSDKIKVFNP